MVVDTVYTHGVQLQICSLGMKHGKEGITSMTNTVSEDRAQPALLLRLSGASKGTVKDQKYFHKNVFP